MSRWISQEAERLVPYTPGEQPQDCLLYTSRCV